MTVTNMRQGTCPACGSQEVYCLKAIKRQFMVELGYWGAEDIPSKVLVCVECGRCERYLQLTDKHKKKIRDEAPRVQG
ncbi:hypothetical protein [Streptomyces sp. Isolate_219]|uniref:hypothetical protein n=1 Tax=Streptomyces sp. Isolate_219 TaxID=2950110 RepID=UPI0021C5D023|nr:hypothetical protein [Streptomyces sp. Isolate_219]MCR8573498.1 hypothetical protein [Streptomyces sp. Isolate_219]